MRKRDLLKLVKLANEKAFNVWNAYDYQYGIDSKCCLVVNGRIYLIIENFKLRRLK